MGSIKNIVYASVAIFIVFIGVVAFIGDKKAAKATTAGVINKTTVNGVIHTIVVIDGCQYIEYGPAVGGSIVHKGNCPNHKL